uniref:Altered inheritance of mitochondria protein 24, mitochondrial n=1 Tax=Chenopodium quinoa TaxID=63459 RepID=A0A803LWX0_CHEQI
MAAPFFNTPFQPYVYQSPQDAVTPFQILGGEAQIVQIMLKPQEKVIARPGSMCYTSGSVQMDNVYITEQEVGMWQWIFGKTVTSIVLHNSGSSDGFVGIAAPSLARILPIDLAVFGGELRCQPDAFLCSVNDVKVTNVTTDPRARNAVVGAEKNLEVGEVLAVDASCIAAVTTTVNVEVKYNGPMRRGVFGADNLVTAVLTGPGIVFIQSLPFQRLSQRVARAVTAPNVRENPKFFIQLAIFFFLAYVVIVSSLLLTDV